MSMSPDPGALPAADSLQFVFPACASRQRCVDRDWQSRQESREPRHGGARDSCGHSHWPLPLNRRPFPGLQHLVIELLSLHMLLTEEVIPGTRTGCHYISHSKFDRWTAEMQRRPQGCRITHSKSQ